MRNLGSYFIAILISTVVFAQDLVGSYDYIPDATYDEIGDKLSCLDTQIPLNYNDRVRGFIDYFTVRDRSYSRGILDRKDYYFEIFEHYLEKYDLPEE